MSKLLQQVRDEMRTRHYSYRTEQTYLHWIKQFILFHDKQHPSFLGSEHIAKFLTYLAVERTVAPQHKTKALAALLFLYKQVLHIELSKLENVARAKRPVRLPAVFTRKEAKAVLASLHTPMVNGQFAWDRRYCQVKAEDVNLTVPQAYSFDAHFRFSLPSSSFSRRDHQSFRLVILPFRFQLPGY